MSATRSFIPPQVLWPALVIAFLVASLSVCGLTAYFALSDPSFAVEKDYYEKALNWDKQAAQLRVNEALGWTVRATLAEGETHRDADTITLTLKDKAGAMIEGAEITASVFHPARSGDRHDVVFAFADGVYVGTGQFDRRGDWRGKGTALVRTANSEAAGDTADQAGGETVFTFECVIKRRGGGA